MRVWDRARVRSGGNIDTLDLRNAAEIKISNYAPRVTEITAVVEVKEDAKVLATLRQRINVTPTPPPELVAAMNNGGRNRRPPAPRPQRMTACSKWMAQLDVDGVPKGAGLAIRPPPGDIPPCGLTAAVTGEAVDPLERRLEGKITDVNVGGGGRYLLLTLKAAGKLAVFDMNAADVVKSIPLASPNALVAAGAKKILIALPDQKRIERRDLATLKRAMATAALCQSAGRFRHWRGSDSDGPALAVWLGDANAFGFLRGPGAASSTSSRSRCFGSTRPTTSAPSGSAARRTRAAPLGSARAKSGGTPAPRRVAGSLPSGKPAGSHESYAVVVHGSSIDKTVLGGGFYLVPGPDGRTVYTGTLGRLHADGRLVGRSERVGDQHVYARADASIG